MSACHPERSEGESLSPQPMTDMKSRSLTVLWMTLLLAACAPRYKTEVIPTISGPARPFSPAVKANGFIFLSGQIGTDSTGARIVPGGAKRTE